VGENITLEGGSNRGLGRELKYEQFKNLCSSPDIIRTMKLKESDEWNG
jgi:hypothetical protein